VQRFGGFVAKYMGDGVLVYFGYPQAHEDDAERAVRAGLELVASVATLKTHAPLQTRVGIATGLVVVGDLIGAGASQEQAIVGETPNLAARLQGIAEPNSVVIAESTRSSAACCWIWRRKTPSGWQSGCVPRRGFLQTGERLMVRNRFARRPAALLLFDLDHFKLLTSDPAEQVGRPHQLTKSEFVIDGSKPPPIRLQSDRLGRQSALASQCRTIRVLVCPRCWTRQTRRSIAPRPWAAIVSSYRRVRLQYGR
jgi:hypothetical protein